MGSLGRSRQVAVAEVLLRTVSLEFRGSDLLRSQSPQEWCQGNAQMPSQAVQPTLAPYETPSRPPIGNIRRWPSAPSRNVRSDGTARYSFRRTMAARFDAVRLRVTKPRREHWGPERGNARHLPVVSFTAYRAPTVLPMSRPMRFRKQYKPVIRRSLRPVFGRGPPERSDRRCRSPADKAVAKGAQGCAGKSEAVL